MKGRIFIKALFITSLAFFVFISLKPAASSAADEPVIAKMQEINKQLAAQGLNYAIEAIEVYTIGQGKPEHRIHQTPFRWVPYDERRYAQGEDITYLVDQSDGATTSGLTNDQTEPAIDRALTTWNNNRALKKVNIVKRDDLGYDPDIFDDFIYQRPEGYPFYADIVNAGWLPKKFFDDAAILFDMPDMPPEGGGHKIIAFSITYVFLEYAYGPPSDINGDNYIDTAFVEIYYNNNFGDPSGTRPERKWTLDIVSDNTLLDVETIALHENGHSLGLGHFGPPPDALMNPRYVGSRRSPYPIDEAGMNAVWGSWPDPSEPRYWMYVPSHPCVGESVLFNGHINEIGKVMDDGSGGFHARYHLNLQDFSGIGMTSNETYRLIDTANQSINSSGSGLPYEETYVEQFKIVGPGPGNDYILRITFHITFNANGVITADVDKAEWGCK